MKLYEVSIVTFPAYTETSVSARKSQIETLRRRSLEAWRERMLGRLKGE